MAKAKKTAKATFTNASAKGPSFKDITPQIPPVDQKPVEPIARTDKPRLARKPQGQPYPEPTPANPPMRTEGEASISTERVTLSTRMRFNPLRGLTPERLSQYLDQFDIGFFRLAAITWDKIERRDTTLKSVAPKRKKAVARHGYDILTLDKLPDGQKDLAERQQAALKYFYDNLTATDAIRPDQRGGLNLLARQMMDCQSKYYAVHEIVWQPGPQGLTAQFVFCPLWWFEAVTGKLRYLDNEFQVYGRDMAPAEWLVTVGEGYMEACSVAWMFKHLSMQDWVAYCEKFGQPFIDAATSASPGGDDWNALVEYVRNFGTDGGGVRSNNAEIKFQEPKNSAVDVFGKMVENMNRAMTILWRGGDLGTNSSQDATGASLQGDESDILEGDDSVLIEETLALNVSRYVISWMFGPETPVLAFLKFKTEQDPGAVEFQREVVKGLLQNQQIAAVLANQIDLKKLTQDVNLPVNEDYDEPYLPVTGEVDKPDAAPPADPSGKTPDQNAAAPANGAHAAAAEVGDVQATALNGAQVAALAELATQVATKQLPIATAISLATAAFPLVGAGLIQKIFSPLASFTPEKPEQERPAKPAAEVSNEAPAAEVAELEANGQAHYAQALAEDLAVIREELKAIDDIADPRVQAQRAADLYNKLDALKADILTLPKSAQALANVMVAGFFTGLTERQKTTAPEL